MLVEGEAAFLRDVFLAPFDVAVNEFFHLAADGADQVIVMIALIELKRSGARLEMTANDDARFGKLHQHAVNGREGNVDLLVDQETVDLFSRQVLGSTLMKKLQDAQPWQCHFQTGLAQCLGNIHEFVHQKKLPEVEEINSI